MRHAAGAVLARPLRHGMVPGAMGHVARQDAHMGRCPIPRGAMPGVVLLRDSISCRRTAFSFGIRAASLIVCLLVFMPMLFI